MTDKGKMTQELFEILVDIDEQAENLTDWESNFISSMVERSEHFGFQTFISEKQEAVLRRIHKKSVGDSNIIRRRN